MVTTEGRFAINRTKEPSSLWRVHILLHLKRECLLLSKSKGMAEIYFESVKVRT